MRRTGAGPHEHEVALAARRGDGRVDGRHHVGHHHDLPLVGDTGEVRRWVPARAVALAGQ
eukprot:4664842-Prymnesium_polylepis.2